jgi:uncharacterized hydrophobic protein (TIGR00271 family)
MLFGSFRRISYERRAEVREEVAALSAPGPSFYLMVAISTIIAAYGLLANSTAVVIGAMLVAPLMGPIFGIALGSETGDRRLLGLSLVSEILGVVLAIVISTLIGLVPLRLDFGTEIAARTQPTIYDIIIALAAGLAGTYAMVDERISPALPGVAIATSLVPPLATCGLCISVAKWDWAFGAFLLFFANLLAIELAAAFIFGVSGAAAVKTQNGRSLARFLRRYGVSILLLIAAGTFMTQTLIRTIADRRFSARLQQAISDQVRSTVGASLSELRYERHRDSIDVVAVVLTPQEFTPEQVGRVEDGLRKRVDGRIHLVLRSLISKDADRKGIVFIPQEQRERTAQVAKQTQFLRRASLTLGKSLAGIAGARLVDLRRELNGNQNTVTAVVRTPSAIEPAQVVEMERSLQQAVGEPLRLIVRSVLTRDADSQGYVYEPQRKSAPLTGEALRFHQRVEQALRNQIGRGVEGASLLEFRYARRNQELLLLAVVRTPRAFGPAQVARIQEAFRKHVDPATLLIVRSDVGADTAATGFLSGFDESKLQPGAR